MPLRMLCVALLVTLGARVAAAQFDEPRLLVDGVAVELIAHEPHVVTPVGMTFDASGRLLVIESHTHQRPDEYEGPPHDRVRMLSDADGDGALDTWSTYAEGYTHAMNLAALPTGRVLLVTRSDVRVLHDPDGDGRADSDRVIVRLETDADYPHNGLGGIAVGDAGDGLVLGLGENFGAEYKLVGADGSTLAGRGGVGVVFTCDLDGGSLERYAVGFWNPFGLEVAQGQVFCVDNDPDASPPCRLIHVLPAGDYGHRWEYGRAGVHPLQAWDGELPGTLGMMAGTGEAPCAVVWHRGGLWVTSWGEHRIERYELVDNQSMLGAKRQVILQGDASFRPTGMAVAPDGSLYFADWVSRSYPVHGQGRIWRLMFDANMPGESMGDAQATATLRQLQNSDVVSRQRGIWAAAQDRSRIALAHSQWEHADPAQRLTLLQTMRWGETDRRDEVLRDALADSDPNVRLYAVRWIADEHLTVFKEDVARLLEGDIPSERYYLAVLAAVDWLSRPPEPRHGGLADGLLARELRNERRSPAAHALALRMISPDHKLLTLEKLREYVASGDIAVRTEAVRTLALQSNPERFTLLAEIASDDAFEAQTRADAVAGLASGAIGYADALRALANDGSPPVSSEARRVLRLCGLTVSSPDEKPSPNDLDAWLDLLQAPGDADSGRRLFYSSVGARCGVCHAHSGCGGQVGPELTHVGQRLSRRRLIESILQPSREIAPRYEPWVLELADGRVMSGLRMPKGGDDGVEAYVDSEGKPFELASGQIDVRTPSQASIMPEGLEKTITVEDLRDLMAFLTNGGHARETNE